MYTKKKKNSVVRCIQRNITVVMLKRVRCYELLGNYFRTKKNIFYAILVCKAELQKKTLYKRVTRVVSIQNDFCMKSLRLSMKVPFT